MAVPKKRLTRTQRDKRRTHDRLTPGSLAACSHCKEPKVPHRVCPKCGYYDGKEVIIPKE